MGHPDHLIPVDQDELRVEVVVGFKQSAVAGGRVGYGGKRDVGRSVRSQNRTVPAVEINRSDVQLPDVPHTDQAGPIKALVANADDSRTSRGELGKGGRASNESKPTHSLHAQAAGLKGAARGEETILRKGTCVTPNRRKACVSVVGI